MHIYIHAYIHSCTLGYRRNGFVAAHALERMMYGYALLVPVGQGVLGGLSGERGVCMYVCMYVCV